VRLGRKFATKRGLTRAESKCDICLYQGEAVSIRFLAEIVENKSTDFDLEVNRKVVSLALWVRSNWL
jgi:hypothetical protein